VPLSQRPFQCRISRYSLPPSAFADDMHFMGCFAVCEVALFNSRFAKLSRCPSQVFSNAGGTAKGVDFMLRAV
jgi:hypothetical protein